MSALVLRSKVSFVVPLAGGSAWGVVPGVARPDV